MVCTYLPKLFWPTVRKIVLVIDKNFWNSRLKAKKLQIFWDYYNNFFKQWKSDFPVLTLAWNFFEIEPHSTKCENLTIADWSQCLKSELQIEFQQNLGCKLSYFNQLNLPNLTECEPGENDYQKIVYRKAADIIWSLWLKGIQ